MWKRITQKIYNCDCCGCTPNDWDCMWEVSNEIFCEDCVLITPLDSPLIWNDKWVIEQISSWEFILRNWTRHINLTFEQVSWILPHFYDLDFDIEKAKEFYWIKN
jgi:hypothetical protein